MDVSPPQQAVTAALQQPRGRAELPRRKARIQRWLASPDRLARDGRMLSWSNCEHPGYGYDEATVLLAAFWLWRGDSDRSQALIGPLQARLGLGGWLGRDEIGYAFDTALALPLLADPRAAARRVMVSLREQRACTRITRPGWWSQSYGAHLIKCGFWLARVGERAFAERLAADLVERCFDGERFHIHGEADETYLHSHCYALEGLLGLGLQPEVVSAGVLWLARQQAADGSLPDWYRRSSECRPADVCAQAVRLWAAVDPIRFEVPIALGLRYLAVLQDEDGGIRYHQDSCDVNSWASIFALQAMAWLAVPPSHEELQWLL